MDINGKFYCSKCLRPIDDDGLPCPYCGHQHGKKSEDSLALEEDTLLSNRYLLGSVIGSGGFGITYAAWDEVLQCGVAIKEYCPREYITRVPEETDEITPIEDFRKEYFLGLRRFMQEAQVIAMLRDVPGIVGVQDSFEGNSTYYIVMEYIHGVPFDAYVQQNHCSAKDILRMLRTPIDALIAAHRHGILHRDIKPENLLVQEDGQVRLIDFGSAVDLTPRAEDHTVVLSRSYAAIEQYDKKGKLGPWTDVYGISATLYALLTGEPPQESVLRQKHDQLVIPALLKKYQKKALQNGLAVQPDRRIQSMEEFRSRLYGLPLPEEIIQRKRLILRISAVFTAFFSLSILLIVNFFIGFPMGDGIRYSFRADGLHLVDYDANDQLLTIPSHRIGIPVTEIDADVFRGNQTLERVSIPGTVHTVGAYAFNNCSALTEVVLSEGVEKLDTQSFSSCTSLQAVMVPESLEYISEDSFDNPSDRLVLVGEPEIPAASMASELDIVYGTLITQENDTGLTLTEYITQQKIARVPDSLGGVPITELASGMAEKAVFPEQVQMVTLPNSIKSIGDYALYETHIQDIYVPENVEFIGKRAFSKTFLTSIVLPDSVISMGDSAFSACTELTSATLSAKMRAVPDGCFECAPALSEVIIPEGIEEIGIFAFSQCDSLTALALPETMKEIRPFAFQDCFHLDSIYVSPYMQEIASTAFSGCSKQMTIVGFSSTYAEQFANNNSVSFYSMNSRNPDIQILPSGNIIVEDTVAEAAEIELPSYFFDWIATNLLDARPLKSSTVTLPTHLTSISTTAFQGNTYVEEVICPDSLREIGYQSFEGCANLRTINLPEGLVSIGDGAFAGCTSLTDVQLPDSLTQMMANAFQHCQEVTQIHIPKDLTILENGVFAETGITSVTIPGNIVKCHPAFYGCKELETAVVEEGVLDLWGSFADCTNLKTVVIPESMERISQSTFLNCRNLQDVWIYSKDVSLDFRWLNVSYGAELLEPHVTVYLFRDSPNVTIHGYEGSTAQLYAQKRGLKFEVIPSEEAASAVLPDDGLLDLQQYMEMSYEPLEVVLYFWSEFRYAMGAGLQQDALDCLQICRETALTELYPAIETAELFAVQQEQHGYTAGESVLYFENNAVHPVLHSGDIIVALDGMPVTENHDVAELKSINPDGPWMYTILRPDSEGILTTQVVEIFGEHPKHLALSLSPLYP